MKIFASIFPGIANIQANFTHDLEAQSSLDHQNLTENQFQFNSRNHDKYKSKNHDIIIKIHHFLVWF